MTDISLQIRVFRRSENADRIFPSVGNDPDRVVSRVYDLHYMASFRNIRTFLKMLNRFKKFLIKKACLKRFSLFFD